MKKSILTLTIPAIFASMQGDLTLGTGLSILSPNTEWSNITSSNPYINNLLNDTSVQSNSVGTLSTSLAYMFTDNIAAKINLSLPQQVSLNFKDTLEFNDAINTRMFAPSLQVQYFMFNPEYVYRPYIGAGITYATFSNINISNNSIVQALSSNYQDFSPSWSSVVSMGSTYRFNDRWSLITSLVYMPITTNMTIDGPGNSYLPGQVSTSSVSLQSLDYVVHLGYNI